MKLLGYKFGLTILKALVAGKKGVKSGLHAIRPFLQRLRLVYITVFGFRLYKVGRIFTKKIDTLGVPSRGHLAEFFGKRSTVQLVLFLVALIVMIPHSTLYSKEDFGIPGRKTILYKLAPGDQDYSIEEVGVTNVVHSKNESYSWNDGTVGTQMPRGITDTVAPATELTAGGSLGGSALIKPIVFAPEVVGTTTSTTGARVKTRTEVVNHEVQDGENLSVIAGAYGISIQTLISANGLTEKSILRPGMKLTILPVDGVSHKVRSGDTVIGIAKTYGVGVDEIIAFNELDGPKIRIGDELMIPGGTLPKPQPIARIIQPIQKAAPIIKKALPIPPASTALPSVAGGYVWPTAATIITQYYGWRHTGLDIAGKTGTPVYAARAGTVEKSQCGWNGGYGCYVIIDHGGGVKTLYAHHSQLYVSAGDQVTQGQTIGLMGSTGRSTGPHVHFEVRVNGKFQNPLSYVKK